MKIAVYSANIGNYRNEFSLSRMISIVFSDFKAVSGKHIKFLLKNNIRLWMLKGQPVSSLSFVCHQN